MILLDTNIISAAMRPEPDASIVTWLDAQPAETLFLSVITIAELRHGLAALPKGKRQARLQRAFDEQVLPLFAGRILPFTMHEADIWGPMMAAARAGGKALGPLDGQIAATAKSHGLIVASRDRSPFEAVGLRVLDPWTD